MNDEQHTVHQFSAADVHKILLWEMLQLGLDFLKRAYLGAIHAMSPGSLAPSSYICVASQSDYAAVREWHSAHAQKGFALLLFLHIHWILKTRAKPK